MEAALCLSKPLFTSQAHRVTIIDLHHNAASFHTPSSFHSINRSTRPHQLFRHPKMRVVAGECSPMLVGPMCLCGPLKACPEIVGMKDPKMIMGKKRRVPAWRSLTLEGLRKGSLSLKVLLEVKKARLNPQSLDHALSEFDWLLSQLRQHQHRIEFYKLEEVARNLEMSRKEDLAVETLKRFLSSVSEESIGSHESYVVRLLLVEMLIYQGEFREARDICAKLEEDHRRAIESTPPPDVPVERIGPTDYKLKLYQAVTSAMLGDKEEAGRHWDEFKRLTSRGFGIGGPPKTTTDYDEEAVEEVDHTSTLQLVEESGPPEMAGRDSHLEDEEVENHSELTFPQFLDHVRVFKQEIQAARL